MPYDTALSNERDSLFQLKQLLELSLSGQPVALDHIRDQERRQSLSGLLRFRSLTKRCHDRVSRLIDLFDNGQRYSVEAEALKSEILAITRLESLSDPVEGDSFQAGEDGQAMLGSQSAMSQKEMRSEFRQKLTHCLTSLQGFEVSMRNEEPFDLAHHRHVLDNAILLFDEPEFLSIKSESKRLTDEISMDPGFDNYRNAVSAVHDCYKAISSSWNEFQGRFSLDVRSRYMGAGVGIIEDYSTLLPFVSRLHPEERRHALQSLRYQFSLAESEDEILRQQETLLSHLIDRVSGLFNAADDARAQTGNAIKEMTERSQLALKNLFECYMVLQLPAIVRFIFLCHLEDSGAQTDEVKQLKDKMLKELQEIAANEVTVFSEETSWMRLIPGFTENKAEIPEPAAVPESEAIVSVVPEKCILPVIGQQPLEVDEFLPELVSIARAVKSNHDFDEMLLRLEKLKSSIAGWLQSETLRREVKEALSILNTGKNPLNDQLSLLPEQQLGLLSIIFRFSEVCALSTFVSRAEGEILVRQGKFEHALSAYLEAQAASRTLTARFTDENENLCQCLEESARRSAELLFRSGGTDSARNELLQKYESALKHLAEVPVDISMLSILALCGIAIVPTEDDIDVMNLDNREPRWRQAYHMLKDVVRVLGLENDEMLAHLTVSLESGQLGSDDDLYECVVRALNSSITFDTSMALDWLADVRAALASGVLTSVATILPNEADVFAQTIGGKCSSIAEFYREGDLEYVLGPNSVLAFNQTLKMNAVACTAERVGSFFQNAGLSANDFVKMLERIPAAQISDELRHFAHADDTKQLDAQLMGRAICDGVGEHHNVLRAQLALKLVNDRKNRQILETVQTINGSACPHILVDGLHVSVAPLEKISFSTTRGSQLRVSVTGGRPFLTDSPYSNATRHFSPEPERMEREAPLHFVNNYEPLRYALVSNTPEARFF